LQPDLANYASEPSSNEQRSENPSFWRGIIISPFYPYNKNAFRSFSFGKILHRERPIIRSTLHAHSVKDNLNPFHRQSFSIVDIYLAGGKAIKAFTAAFFLNLIKRESK